MVGKTAGLADVFAEAQLPNAMTGDARERENQPPGRSGRHATVVRVVPASHRQTGLPGDGLEHLTRALVRKGINSVFEPHGEKLGRPPGLSDAQTGRTKTPAPAKWSTLYGLADVPGVNRGTLRRAIDRVFRGGGVNS